MQSPTIPDVEYPESDGQPMGETDLHIDWIFRLRDMLKRHYRGQQVYVAANLLLYYDEGVPRHFLVPDVFVVNGIDPGMRRIYKTWVEGTAPHFVLEVTSASTRREDEAFKPDRYARIGVRELFLYDPTADYLNPPLRGYRLIDGEFTRLEPDSAGWLESMELGLRLRLEGNELQLFDSAKNVQLLTSVEAADRAETTAKQAAAEAIAEIQRLRDLLKRHGLSE